MSLSKRLRRLSAIICAMLILLNLPCGSGCFAVPSAQAAQTQILEISVRSQPDALTEADEVTLYFTIVNTGDDDAKNVLLSSADGLLSEPVGDIAAGETQHFNRTHSVTAQELDAGGFNCILSHSDPDDADALVNYNVWVSISRSTIEPSAEFTRRCSARSVVAGGSVVITYNIKNTGNTALTEVTVTDDLGDYKGYAERVEVGESCTLINRASVTQPSVSHAEMSCKAEGSDDTLSQTLDDVNIVVAEGQLNCILRAGYSAFSAETADVVMLLSATGDMSYHDLCITDETYGGVIADQISVKAGGEPVEISISCPVRSDEGFCWRVTGVDDAGNAVDVLSNVATLPQRENIPEANITMTAEALTPRIRRSGDVRIRVTIANSGGKSVKQLTLSEATQGMLREFVVLPADGTIVRDFVMHVDDDTDYNFTLGYVTEDGATQTLEPVTASVVIASDGVLPEGAAPGLIEFSGTGIKIAGSSTFAVLLIIGCVLLLTLIVLLLIASRRARLEKQLRAAERLRKREAAKAKDKGRE